MIFQPQLTGDAVAITKGTCKQLQLRTNVYDSQKLIWSGMSGSDFGFNNYSATTITRCRLHLSQVIILDDGKPYFSWIIHVV
ncbi:hypothetical protein B0H13DRAFT_2310189 [Mycena leptocephala]|nr:hypothetical protein B0H13DRAFT_2310189 [Mycena leptocephala]